MEYCVSYISCGILSTLYNTSGHAPQKAKERENVADMKAYVQEVLEKIAVKDPQEKEFQDTAKEINYQIGRASCRERV